MTGHETYEDRFLRNEKGQWVKGRVLPIEMEYKKRVAISEAKKQQPNLSPSEPLAYLLGIILGDGSVSKTGTTYTIKLNTIDKPFARSFKEVLKSIGLRAHMYPLNRYGLYTVQSSSVIFGDWFHSLTPDNILELILSRKVYCRAFIRGFYESEGNTKKCPNGHRGTSMCNTELWKLELVSSALRAIHLKHHIKGPYIRSGKKFAYNLSIIKRHPIDEEFFREINPCIKR